MDMSGQLHTPAGLNPGKSLWYPFDRRLNGPRSGLYTAVEKGKLLAPSVIEPQSSNP